MVTKLVGKITSRFGNDINTDDIIRADVLQESTEKSFFAKHAFEKFDQDFISRCSNEKSNIIIAGDNFGCGSSREHAVYALTYNNVKVVIAKSFPDIFYRNAINNGLILIRLDQVLEFKLGEEIEIDLENGKILGHCEEGGTTDEAIHTKGKSDSSAAWIASSQNCSSQGRLIYNFSCDETDLFIMKHGGQLGVVKDYLKDGKIEIVSSRFNLQNGTNNEKNLEAGQRPAPAFGNVETLQCNVSTMDPSLYSGGRLPQTIVEKIISNHVGKDVYAGDKISALPIDLIYLNEVIGPAAIKYFKKDFGDKTKVFDNSKVYLIPDHSIPSCSVAVSQGIDSMKEFANDQGIKMFKQGRGIEHIVFIEEGLIKPGQIVLGTDSHTCTNGALNCLALGVGTTDSEYAMATGAVFNFTVPETIRVNLVGKFQKGVYAKDLILYLVGKIGAKGASKKIIEFGGSALDYLGLDAKTTIANMCVEMSARSGIFEELPITNNASYSQTIDIDLSSLDPMIAFPHSPENVCSISELKNQIKKSQKTNSETFPSINESDLKITTGFIGACTNGKYDDLVEAAKILKGKKIHKDVDLVIVPASDQIYKKALQNGLIEIFINAGAMVEMPNCSMCFGKHQGVASEKSRIISTSNRNYKGRMGHQDSKIFLASPTTVAASCIEGFITNPKNFI